MLSGRPEAGPPEPGGAAMSRPRFLANVLAYRVAGVEAPFERGRWARLLSERLEATDVVHLHNAHSYYLPRSEEHTSELQSLMRISYAVFCLKKKKKIQSKTKE